MARFAIEQRVTKPEDLKKFNAELKNKFNKELEYDGVPTLARISGGNINYYKGERKAEQMKKWALNEKKGGKKTLDIVGLNSDDFRKYIEKLFSDGMCWDNYGFWHLDHIKPICLAKTEEEILKFNHYTNLQPLWAEDNLKKNRKI